MQKMAVRYEILYIRKSKPLFGKTLVKKHKKHPPFYSPDISSKILKRKKTSTMVFYKDIIDELA